MDKDLIIKLGLDKSPAAAAIQGFVETSKQAVKATVEAHAAGEHAKTSATTAGVKQRADATAGAAKAETDAGRRVLSSAEVVEQAKRNLIDQTNRKRVEAAAANIATSSREAAAAKGVGAALAATGTAAETAGKAGSGGFLAMAASMGVGQIAAQKLTEAIHVMGQALDAALAKRKEWERGFSATRDELGELAMLMGREADDKFTLDIAKYGRDTGQTPQESKELLTELYNSGAAYKGKNLSDKEFDQYGVRVGQLATAKGLNRAQMGDLAGTVAGFTDYQAKFGDQASEQALGKVNSAVGILGRGKGRNSVLMNQFNMLGSASLNEDELKGTFQDSDEVASVISIMASKHDAQAAELAKMAGRALRGFDKDQGALLAKVGINAKTSFIDAIKKLAPEVEKQAKEQGVKTEDILRQHFKDEGAVDALNVAINEGVFKGGFDDRAAFGKTLQGVKPAQGTIDKFLASDRGAKRIAAADKNVIEMEKGAKQAPLETLRTQAENELTREGLIDTTQTNFEDNFMNVVSLKAFGDFRQRRIDARADEIAKRRTPPGVKAPGGFALNADEAEDQLRERLDAIKAAGGEGQFDVGRLALPKDAAVPMARPVGPGAALGPEARDQFNGLMGPDPLANLRGPAAAPMGWRGALGAAMMGDLPAAPAERAGARGAAPLEGGRTEALLEAIHTELKTANEQRAKVAPAKNPPIVGRPVVQTR